MAQKSNIPDNFFPDVMSVTLKRSVIGHLLWHNVRWQLMRFFFFARNPAAILIFESYVLVNPKILRTAGGFSPGFHVPIWQPHV